MNDTHLLIEEEKRVIACGSINNLIVLISCGSFDKIKICLKYVRTSERKISCVQLFK